MIVRILILQDTWGDGHVARPAILSLVANRTTSEEGEEKSKVPAGTLIQNLDPYPKAS
jgi:hypothetical protein